MHFYMLRVIFTGIKKRFEIMAKLLLGIEEEVKGSWYAPERYLREQRDVMRVELWNTTSSAGDWDGFFVQKYKGRYWMIIFWQECVAWTPYYNLYTSDEPSASFKELPTLDECYTVMERLTRMYQAA